MHLTLEARIENIEPLTEFVNDQLRRMGCSERARMQIDVALDEIFSNICRYAYGNAVGPATVRVKELPEQDAVSITLEDGGIPFDPLAKSDPDVSLGIHERSVGGLGIFMVKNIMNDVRYEHRDGLNVLTVIKSL